MKGEILESLDEPELEDDLPDIIHNKCCMSPHRGEMVMLCGERWDEEDDDGGDHEGQECVVCDDLWANRFCPIAPDRRCE